MRNAKRMLIRAAALTALLAALFAPNARAQSTVAKGDNLFSIGVGAAPNYYSGFYTSYNVGSSLGLYLRYAKATNLEVGPGVLTLGGMVGVSRARYRYDGFGASYRHTWTNIPVLFVGEYHYDFDVPQLDTYVGLGLGFRLESYNHKVVSGSGAAETAGDYGGVDAAGAFYMGGAYYFNDQLAAFLELGRGVTLVSIGVTAKF